mmetsp:Transcript_34570/g.75712  ORF Transcript_34570/g.75712 Transcript_34570/m.75712 type:complete len:375 (+) Transcript_34570:1320-2444(+)
MAELLLIDGFCGGIARQEEQGHLHPSIGKSEPGPALGHGLIEGVAREFLAAALAVLVGEIGLVIMRVGLPHQPLHRLRSAPPIIPQGVRLVEQVVALGLLPVDHHVGEVLRQGQAVGDPVGEGVEVVVPRDLRPPAPGQRIPGPDGGTVGGVDKTDLAQARDQLDGMHDIVLQSLQISGEKLILEVPGRGLRVGAQPAVLLVRPDEDTRALLANVLGPSQIADHREPRKSCLLSRRNLWQGLRHHVLMLNNEAGVVGERQPHYVFGELTGPQPGGVHHRVELLHRLAVWPYDCDIESARGPRRDRLDLHVHLHHRPEPLGVLGHGVGEQGGVNIPIPRGMHSTINIFRAQQGVHLLDLSSGNHPGGILGVVVQC